MARVYGAFREAYLSSAPTHEEAFESLKSRTFRYALYWAFFESSVYDRVHNWSQGYKFQLGLSKHIRPLYNPAFRIGTFYASHLWGGDLDSEAGPDGCIPILVDSGDDEDNVEREKRLRAAIATTWRASNFASLKDVIALRGTIEGDVILRVTEDPDKSKVYIERVSASQIVELTKDAYGNVKGYVQEYQRKDGSRDVTYRLEVTREGENVVFATFKNKAPFGWDGLPARWEQPYGFVPLVHIAHHDVGLEWGWSELHPMRTKVTEVDNLASMLSDQIGKYVNPLYLMKNIPKPSSSNVTGATPVETGGTDTRHAPGLEELPAVWNVPSDGEAMPVVADLNLEHALAYLNGLLKEIERDYPELRVDYQSTAGARGAAPSGRALRIARQQVESKVRARREGYDSGLVRAQMMALSIGGLRSYEGYEGFSLESYDAGDLDHTIAPRPVFEPDPLDDIEIKTAFWTAAKTAREAGASVEGFLRREGLSDDEIAEVTAGEAVQE